MRDFNENFSVMIFTIIVSGILTVICTVFPVKHPLNIQLAKKLNIDVGKIILFELFGPVLLVNIVFLIKSFFD